ncbi:MAG: universal stress protein E [Cryomorphaceae bacterium]|jgi:universal stress protein E
MNTLDKSILVAVDYSRTSKMALREAARIANAQEVDIEVMHVIDEDIVKHFTDQKAKFDRAGVLDSEHSRLEKFIADSIGTGKNIKTEVLIGNPFREIIEAVNQKNHSLLALGANGHSNRYSSRAGVLASKCVRKAAIDVLLVRRGHDRLFNSIIACVDFSDNSIESAYKAGEIAVLEGASLKLVYVFKPPVQFEELYGWATTSSADDPESSITYHLEQKLDEISKEIQSKYSDIDISVTVNTNMRVSSGMNEQIDETNADLVVLGTRGRTGLRTFLLGTTAERIIHDSQCSVYAVKPEGFKYEL